MLDANGFQVTDLGVDVPASTFVDKIRELRPPVVALSGLLTLVPGPSVLAYYFAFRVVGHYFSMRGARQGLDRVQWTTRASDALADLRPLVPVDPDERRSRVEAIAARLQLLDLRRFFDRVAVPGA
jgi:hypothetical protein